MATSSNLDKDTSMIFLGAIMTELELGTTPPVNYVCADEDVEKSTNKQQVMSYFLQAEFHLSMSTEVLSEDNVEVTAESSTMVDIDTLTCNINKVLTGKVFIGRVVSKPLRRKSSLCLPIEDPKGLKVVIVLIHKCPEATPNLYNGAILLIANPCFTTIEKNYIVLRKDYRDIIILTPDEAKGTFPGIKWSEQPDDGVSNATSEQPDNAASNSTPEQHQQQDNEASNATSEQNEFNSMQAKGNQECFILRDFSSAIESYTRALQISPNDQTVLANRSYCYLRLEKYELGLMDSKRVLELNPRHIKAIHRTAKAFMGMRMFDKAKEFLTSTLESNIPQDHIPDLVNLLNNVEKFIQQQDHGNYNMIQLHSSRNKTVFHSVVDYIGPVQLANMSGKGRGLIVTEDVPAGRLLICCKPFVMNLDYEKDADEITKDLHKFVVGKLKAKPEFGKQFYQLYAGESMGYLDPWFEDCYKIDTNRIMKIIKYNTFQNELEEFYCSGIWIWPSFINNDCYAANCFNTLYGDVRQIRTIRPLKRGEEITISYEGMNNSFRECRMLTKIREFGCKCDKCLHDAGDTSIGLSKREMLYMQLKTKYDTPHPQDIRKVIKKIKLNSQGYPFLDHYLFEPLFELGRLHFERHEYKKCIEALKELLDCWDRGGTVNEHSLLYSSTAFICLSYMHLGMHDLAKQWRDLFVSKVQLTFGRSDHDMLEAIYPDITRTLALLN